MQIAGIQKTTLVDYDGKVASTIFTRGCSFRCGFCHNPDLVISDQFLPLLDEPALWEFFEKRKDKLDGVCITGGEPTLNKDLLSFSKRLFEMGYKVKLDSNGHNPKFLDELISSGYIDYIAMDIKGPIDKYSSIAFSGCEVPLIPESTLIKNIKQSIDLIIQSKLNYEFRTTFVKPLHQKEDAKAIGELIKGSKKYYLQNFVHSKHIKNTEYSSFTTEELEQMKKDIEKYVETVAIR